jgi:hypothetical protein
MSQRWRILALMVCMSAVACSGGERKGTDDGKMDAGGGDGDGDGDADGDAGAGPHTPGIGDEVDVDGDGVIDGVIVDEDHDGVADGVDTDGDGKADEPVPVFGPDGGIYIPPDSGTGPFPVDESGQVLCGSAPCACSDGMDNDGDHVSDLEDPECVSSWDNDEASFATGISGDNRDDACQDCFFDGNSGSGNDGCYLPSSCLSEGNDSSGHGICSSCEQTDQCKNFCKAFTPNGCDCFGCCTVHLENGSTKSVLLGSGCNIDGNDVTGCTACVPNDSCVNTCGTCELCPGKTVDDLPPECFTGGDGDGDGDGDAGTGGGGTPGVTCEDGAVRCGSGLPACASDSACEFGCCVKLPELL